MLVVLPLNVYISTSREDRFLPSAPWIIYVHRELAAALKWSPRGRTGRRAAEPRVRRGSQSASLPLNIIIIKERSGPIKHGGKQRGVRSGRGRSAALFTLQMRLSYTMYSKTGPTASNSSHLPTKASFPESSSLSSPLPSSALSRSLSNHLFFFLCSRFEELAHDD